MKILIVHNFHRKGSSSGDDVVVDNEIKLLRQLGHEVVVYSKNNTDFEEENFMLKLWHGLQIPWSWENYKSLRKIIGEHNPNIVHVHTFFPLLSPSVYSAIYDSGKPIVQSLHDFRFFCAKAFFFRDGEICEECTIEGMKKALKYRCFQNSYAKTLLVLGALYMAKKGRVLEKVSAFITFTEFGKKKFSQLGIPEEKIYVKPHFIFPEDIKQLEKKEKNQKYFLFLGRLGEEKGIRFLLDAWKLMPRIPLKIAGSGPLKEWVKDTVENMANVEYLGFFPYNAVRELLREAYAVILPSICYETFGMVVMEAYSVGVPVVATNFGSLGCLVRNKETGLLFQRKNKEDFIDKITWLWEHKEEREKMSANARKEFESKYTPEKNYEILMDIYKRVIESHKKAG